MTTPSTSSKAPSHYAYQVRERESKTAIWTRIGAAWAQKDGKGFTAQLDAVPLDGRITFRVPSEASE